MATNLSKALGQRVTNAFNLQLPGPLVGSLPVPELAKSSVRAVLLCRGQHAQTDAVSRTEKRAYERLYDGLSPLLTPSLLFSLMSSFPPFLTTD